MNTTLQVNVKNVYGNELIYPANDVAEKFTRLMGKKTITKWDLSIIKDLGYTIEVMTPVLV